MSYNLLTYHIEDRQKTESGPPEHGVPEQRPLFYSYSLYCFLGGDNNWRTTCVWGPQSVSCGDSRGGSTALMVWIQTWLCCRHSQQQASFTVLHKDILMHWRIRLLFWKVKLIGQLGLRCGKVRDIQVTWPEKLSLFTGASADINCKVGSSHKVKRVKGTCMWHRQ